MKSIPSKEFFRLVALNAGITDLQTVKDIYYAMIKTISRELKGKQTIDLPDWGNFALKLHKGRKIFNVNDKTLINIPAKATVRFSPHRAVKKYFHEFGKEGGTMIK